MAERKKPIEWAREAQRQLEVDRKYLHALEELFAQAIDQAEERSIEKGYRLERVAQLAREYRSKIAPLSVRRVSRDEAAECVALGLKLDAALAKVEEGEKS